MDTITLDGGWNEENCNIALNCFLAGHKISPNLKYQEERNQDGYFHFKTVYCLFDLACSQILARKNMREIWLYVQRRRCEKVFLALLKE